MAKRRSDPITKNFTKEMIKLKARINKAVDEWVVDLKNISDTYTPMDTGALRESFFYNKLGSLRGSTIVMAEVGYGEGLKGDDGKSYAAEVHEFPSNLNWTTPGTGPRFLERALYESIPNLTAKVGVQARIR